MNDDFGPASLPLEPPAVPRSDPGIGTSSIYRLCEEIIGAWERAKESPRLDEARRW